MHGSFSGISGFVHMLKTSLKRKEARIFRLKEDNGRQSKFQMEMVSKKSDLFYKCTGWARDPCTFWKYELFLIFYHSLNIGVWMLGKKMHAFLRIVILCFRISFRRSTSRWEVGHTRAERQCVNSKTKRDIWPTLWFLLCKTFIGC